jgi:hypothetical protein
MRRLTLILSDLYLPEEAVRGSTFPSALEMPHLDGLLRFASFARRIDDWRRWLGADLGAKHLAGLTIAQACSIGRLSSPEAERAWLATPVHLEARLDHVRLADRGLLRLGADERSAWISEFTRSFGPDYVLHDAGERSFLLSGASEVRAASVDPARLLDADIGRALPFGPAAGELRRLGTEIEMWLHGAVPNLARERARDRRVSALWLWGGGAAKTDAAIAPSAPLEGARVYGGDPYLSALGAPVFPVPGFPALDRSATRWVVELAPMSGPKSDSLANLDAHWFAPARAALGDGTLAAVDVVANDRWFRIAAHPSWRLWRRKSSWLAQLGRDLKA